MRRFIHRHHALPALLALALFACGQVPHSAGADAKPAAASAEKNLLAYRWNLHQAFAPGGAADSSWHLPGRAALQVVFSAQGLRVNNLCNGNGGEYRLEGRRITVQPIMATQMACPQEGLMSLETRVFNILRQARHWSLQPGSARQAPHLTLEFADGSRWLLVGETTDETRYGSAAERVFWEVAAQPTVCARGGAGGSGACLRVREIRYGADGRKTPIGAWQDFSGGIEGWRHEPGLRSVLRLHRYPPRTPDAKAAYVLDAVVETHREP